ncbi:uncharacterized RNA-binding protein C17H9.04c-like [Zingiber officinale]|uniref:uncharacterized RNA-binding protein C17H9.04c-like n=1 Tax=Zingiber officinale TaxID=94328 RepID=UPI001C4D792C|nr:uncharacterized RNA-binding protein C17H9.04c-like [Zingiber officinale]
MEESQRALVVDSYVLLVAQKDDSQYKGLLSLQSSIGPPLSSGTEKINRKLGDWTCGSCDHLNFSRRDSCQKCGDPRMSAGDPRSDYTSFGRRGGGSSNGFGGGADVRPGDWYCACAAHNFASRATCFKCGAFKDDSSGSGRFDDDARESSRGHGGRRAGWKSGDWICHRSGCNEHNFANRVECFRCSAPREYGNYMIIYVISVTEFIQFFPSKHWALSCAGTETQSTADGLRF